MFISTLVIISFLSLPCGAILYTEENECDSDDCIPYIYCKKAKELFNDTSESTINLYRQTYCGKHRNITKVCCSEFIRLSDVTLTGRIGSISEHDDHPAAQPLPDDSLDTDTNENTVHPNLRLLPTTECGQMRTGRVARGEITDLYEFPWMVLIAYNIGSRILFQCSGTLINSLYVLTAAHCIVDQNPIGARIGEYDLRYLEDCQGHVCGEAVQDRRVNKTIVHPNYKSQPSYTDDIALLRLETPVNMTKRNAQAVCLPTTNELQSISLTSRQGTVAGWGLTEYYEQSPVLLKVVIPIHSYAFCLGYNRDMSTSKQFCAGADKKDACKGDSGGPFMIEEMYNGSFKYIQFGIVSSGPRKCGADTPGLYTDVRRYMNWILDNIEE